MPDAAQMLANMHSRFGPVSAQGEAWMMAVRKGHGVIFESIITSRNLTAYDVSPLICSATIPVFPDRTCAWHGIPEMRERALFCDRYEGYGDFCRCENPSTINPRNAPRLRRHYETIPIALVTATRVPNALRQILHIWSNQGGDVTPITLMVDGYNAEAEHLAKVLNVSALFHNNRAKKGTKHRINEHVKFSLESIFRQYPEVNRAIILEDDLTLSPDFVSYFHQTSILMRFDPAILCVNAYNYNAYRHTAYDPTRIYRVQSYPYYGWMTDRVQAKKLLGNWAPLNAEADWDLWVRKHHVNTKHQVIIPEVPRTKHEGGGGVHVTGYEQELSFHQRPYNLKPNVTLNMIRLWDFAYALDIMRILDKATTVNVTEHPCDKHPVPRYQKKPHAIYVNISGEDDSTNSYKTITRCLGLYPQLYENYQGTVMVKFFETPVIIVACPPSPYCVDVPQSIIYSPTKSDYDHALKHGWRRTNMTTEVMVRVPAYDVIEEFNLENTNGYDFGLRD
ncbi:protein O-linked-mannose beta-1,2-N-acetylglucosaminyltransferase 1-like [Macrobrachium rosenbergii]|uniref:protein O-linked-mannose beta-1,2-N-acetylglucosaminyltransferase 1-like n=1 Tax=Macrobrachium rosenbergii TaxID=79674 RepID=UPI0034D3C15E